ncbi:MAG: MFS transporter [Thermodesulfobacteriota bacterium]|nr:MFS transporter [Thermodesulfobacteriota bacterium]
MVFKNENESAGPRKLWDRPFVFLNLSFFLVFINIAFFYLYPLALSAMGSNRHIIGWVMGLFSVAAVISRPFLGKLVVLKGEYWVVSMGIAVSFAASLCYNVITSVGPGMLLTRALHGIGFSAFISGSFSFVAKALPKEKQGEAFGVLGASLMGAVALAPPFGEFLIFRWGFHVLYLAASGSVILALLTASVAVTSLPRSRPTDKKTDLQYIALLRNRPFFILLISTLVFAHCQSTVPNFLSLIAAEKGGNAGDFFFVAYFAAILVLLTMGRLIDRYGKLLFMRLFYPLLSLGILLIPGMVGSLFFPVSAIMYGVGMGVLFPTHNALAASHGTANEKPAIMSLFTAVYDTGFITGAVVSGWFAHHNSLNTLFWACGILGFAGFILVIKASIDNNVQSG